jgi:hypothetical protein
MLPLPPPIQLHQTGSSHNNALVDKNATVLTGITRSSRGVAATKLHLKGVQIPRKKSIIVSGLSRSTFRSISSVQEYFERYGKICQCVENPKGVWLSEIEKGGIFITFMSEKSAFLAIRDTASKPANSALGPDVRCRSAHSTHCNEFIREKHCNNLNCVLTHDNVKNKNTSPRSISSVAKSFQESFRTAPTILRKEKGAAESAITGAGTDKGMVGSDSATKNCWATTPKSFLDAATGTVQDRSGTPPMKDNDEDGSNCDSFDVLDTSSGDFQLIVTPDSTLTKSTFSSRGTNETSSSLKTRKSYDDENETKVTFMNELQMPPKELFANPPCIRANFGVISPPTHPSKITVESSQQSIQTFHSPWDIKSPIQLEKDNFDTLGQHEILSKPKEIVEQTNEIVPYNGQLMRSNICPLEPEWMTQRNPNNLALVPRPYIYPTQRSSFQYGYGYDHRQQRQPQMSLQYPHCYHHAPVINTSSYLSHGQPFYSQMQNRYNSYYDEMRY